MAEDTTVLSEREREILKLVATGATNQQIAADLGISPNTVKVHLRNIFGKVGVASRTEASMYAVRSGLLDLTTVAEPASVEEPDDLIAETPPVDTIPQTAIPAPVAPPARSPWMLAGLALVGVVLLGLLLWRTLVTAPTTGIPSDPIANPTVAPGTAQINWAERRALPAGLSGAAIVTVDGMIYVIGGTSIAGVENRGWRYAPDSNAWADVPRKPTAVTGAQAVVLAGRVYMPGGQRNDQTISDQLEVYDPVGQQWEQKAQLPAPRTGYGLAAVDGRLYLIGGWDGTQERSETFVYDPQTDRWRELAPMPTARAYGAAVVVDGRIHLLGGEANKVALVAHEQFTPAISGTGTWVQMTPLRQPRSQFGASAQSNLISLFGGAEGLPPERFDVRSSTWETLNGPAVPLGKQPSVITRDFSIFLLIGDPTSPTGQFFEVRTFTVALPRT